MDKFDLVRAKLDHHADAMRYALDRQLFTDGSAPVMASPLTWRRWLRVRVERWRSYWATVWMALKGEDPYEGDGY